VAVYSHYREDLPKRLPSAIRTIIQAIFYISIIDARLKAEKGLARFCLFFNVIFKDKLRTSLYWKGTKYFMLHCSGGRTKEGFFVTCCIYFTTISVDGPTVLALGMKVSAGGWR